MSSSVTTLPEGTLLVVGDVEYAAITMTRDVEFEAFHYEAHNVPDEAWVGTCPSCLHRLHRWVKADNRWVIANAVTRNEPYYCADCHEEHDSITWVCECGYRVVPIYRREPGGVKHRLRSDETSVEVIATGEIPTEVTDAEIRYADPAGHKYVVPLPKVMRVTGDVTFQRDQAPVVTLTGATPVATE